VTAPSSVLQGLSAGVPDLCDAGSVRDFRLETNDSAELSVQVELAPTSS